MTVVEEGKGAFWNSGGATCCRWVQTRRWHHGEIAAEETTSLYKKESKKYMGWKKKGAVTRTCRPI